MRLFGLIGYPLGHSFSKKYFTEKFRGEGITDARFELFPLEEMGQLSDLLASHPDLIGLSVTIPYKERVLPFLDIPGLTQDIGACNCLHRRSGLLYGYNTDLIGFRETFMPGLRSWDKRALILGTGGASKAVAYVLAQAGIAFSFVSRRLDATGEGPTLLYTDITPYLLQSYTVIINCSPVGTFPAIDQAPHLPYEALSPRHYLFDLVYNPEKTRFLSEGERRGASIRNGYDMLRIQAEEAWKIWNA